MVFLLLSFLKSVTRAQTYKVLYVCYSFRLGQTATDSQGLDFIDFENCHVLRNVHLTIKSRGEKSLYKKAACRLQWLPSSLAKRKTILYSVLMSKTFKEIKQIG